jgi:hypothetical protein
MFLQYFLHRLADLLNGCITLLVDHAVTYGCGLYKRLFLLPNGLYYRSTISVYMQLSLDEYQLAGSILQLIDTQLSILDIDIAYSNARELVATVDFNRSAFAMMVWCGLSGKDTDDLIFSVLCKELAQIVTKIDANDSLVDYFGWLLVAKIHGVDVMQILRKLYRNCQMFICKVSY